MRTLPLFALLVALLGCQSHDPDPNDCADLPPPPNLYPSWPEAQIDTWYLRPAFNPADADEFVYRAQDDPTQPTGRAGTWTYNRRTGVRRALLPATTNWFLGPDWGRGGWVVFTGADNQLWKVKSNGDSLTQLTNGAQTMHPHWSPDGQRIVAYRDHGAQQEIVILDKHGQLLERVLDPASGAINPLAWSSDGTRLVLDGGNGRGQFYLFLYDLTTRQLDKLVVVDYLGDPLPNVIYSAAWVPGTSQVAWAGGKGIFVTDVATRQTRQIRTGCKSRIYVFLSVSADGRRIIVDRTNGELNEAKTALNVFNRLYQMNLDGSDEQLVTLP